MPAKGRITAALGATHVPQRTRLILSLLFGCIGGAVTMQKNFLVPHPRDFGQVWFAANAVLGGQDPYALVGPGRAFDWSATLFYPLQAAILAIPLAPFPMPIASILFSVIGGATLAWALMEYGYAPLFGFFSGAVHMAFEVAQWSPLLAASLVIAPAAVIYIAKPTIGLAIFIARPSWWAVGGAVLLTGIAFAVQPEWVPHWRGALEWASLSFGHGFPYVAPVMLPWGFLALACLTKWRRPEARLVAALACVPQTLMLYECVPLFMVPRNFRQTAILVFSSYAVFEYLETTMPGARDLQTYLSVGGRAIVLGMYLPATIIVLSRPNQGPIPAWLERGIVGWPAWLRGSNPQVACSRNFQP